MQDLLIYDATIVNSGERFMGFVRTHGTRIAEVGRGEFVGNFSGEKINATGFVVMPGVIDDQVHFREPGLTYKADIHTESIAAVAGGVTSFMEMPNTKPPTTSLDLLEQKFDIAAANSVANYSFYFGATNDNIKELRKVNPKTTCGVKVFMGSSTGNMLVDDDDVLSAIFAESPTLVATHCEDEPIIRAQTELYRQKYGDAILPSMHPLIRSAEACYRSTAKAVELADKYSSDLHVLHLSTELELALFDSKPLGYKHITNEICVHHLWFSDQDYATKGNMIKWNPAIKTWQDRDALRAGLLNGKVDMVATDHAPHTLEEKRQPYWSCPSGGPLVQHSLVAMLELAREGVLSLERVVEKMCHAPAVRFGVKDRGFLREGAFADIVIVDLDSPWKVEPQNTLYKCSWSPFEGTEFSSKVLYTIINGKIVNRKSEINKDFRGESLEFK